jgi:hypothetical protein
MSPYSASEPALAGTGPTSDAASSAGQSNLERLHPFPGLFLRAEHLSLMQDYTRDLSHLVGECGGGGVVYGFPISLRLTESPPCVLVGPGLAITEEGEPLRSTQDLRIPIDQLRRDVDRFWWIEIASTSWTAGEEPVAGVVCEDPCQGGGSGRPQLELGVVASLRPDRATGLDTDPSQEPVTTRRSWLAAQLYAAEATAAGRWRPGGAAALNDKRWGPLDQEWPIAFKRSGNTVRLGVLLHESGGEHRHWTLDTWAARRDRGAPPPARDWAGRLTMRPWDVYVAQVLQFQAEAAELQRPYVKASSGTQTPRWASLPALGITELPPAAFLPRVGSTAGDIVAEVERILDINSDKRQVDLRYCWCAPGDIGERFVQAQHRDRIPLRSTIGPQPVRMYVPAVAYEDGQTRTWQPVGDWLLIVRDDESFCIEALPRTDRIPEDVEILIGRYADDASYEEAKQAFEAGIAEVPGTQRVPELISSRSEEAGHLPSARSHGYRQILKELGLGHREAVIGSTYQPGHGLNAIARAANVRRLVAPGATPPRELSPLEWGGAERLVLLIRNDG